MKRQSDAELELQVRAAKEGDDIALEAVVRGIQDQVHRLSIRMLVNTEDAFEATQEILILVVTKLSTFRGDSAFRTWVYRVATNYLLNARKYLEKDPGLNFDLYRSDLEEGLLASAPNSPEDEVLLNELRVSCTLAMLLCLDHKHRIAYILGDILELEHAEAAHILDISRANYRQRLSRARNEVIAFTAETCGVTRAGAKCSCPKRLPAAIKMGRVSKHNISYIGSDTPKYSDVVKSAHAVQQDLATLKAQRATGQFKFPEDFANRLSEITAVRQE